MSDTLAFRGTVLHFLDDPGLICKSSSYEYIEDALFVVKGGRIFFVDDFKKGKQSLSDEVEVKRLPKNHIIMPGFIDAHIHYAQTEIIASYGKHLLDWLNEYVFPVESRFSDVKYASEVADLFLQELFRNGTTTAVSYSTVHKSAAEILFEKAFNKNMCIINGKIMMDRNVPQNIRDITPKQSYSDSKELINKWHNKGRLRYAVTPRFAITSSEEQLTYAGALLREFETVYLQTHLAETLNELDFVRKLFPDKIDYTDVYDSFGLLGNRSIFAHGIYLSERELCRLGDSGSVLAWCPTSNFFLGSGIMDIAKVKEHNIKVALSTDIGGGSSFSMLKALNEGYEAAALKDTSLPAMCGFYHITLGNARALSLDSEIGNFVVGKYADFIILNLDAIPLLSHKCKKSKNHEEKMFSLMILGDDRVIESTYINGVKVYQKD